MSDSNGPSLERARDELIYSKDASDVEQALATIAAASADLESRPALQDGPLFSRLLEVLNTNYVAVPPPRALLRCIGNLLSDNEPNRATLIGNADCMRRLENLLTFSTSGDQGSDLEDLALKVVFNLCNDSPEIQKQAFEQGLHRAIITYLHSRQWKPEDDMLLSISASLLASLYDNKTSGNAADEFSADLIRDILGLPSLYAEDLEALIDFCHIVTVMLQDERFILQAVQTKQIRLVWNLIGLVEDAIHGEDVDEDDEKQLRQVSNSLAQSLADMSSLPAFNDKYTLEDEFIKELCQKCIPTDEERRRASLLPGCACLTLGNLAITDDVTTALVPDMISVDELLQHLGKSDESVFLNAAAGLLRHLSIPQTNRERFFNKPGQLKHVAHLYLDVTLEQVQLAGLQLTRQMLIGMLERTQHLVLQSTTSDPPNLNTFLTLFAKTTSTATKLEIARLITTILRTLQSSPQAEPDKECLDALVRTPDILSPLVFAIKQSPAGGVVLAQADAWLALNLFVRIPGGAGILATATAEDDELVRLLRERIAKGPATGAVARSEEGEAMQPGDTRPEWVKEKERDNAVLLVHDLLKAEDLTEKVKDGLRALLDDTKFRVH